MKLLIVDDQSTVVQGLLHCTNWAAMGFTVVDTALNAVDAKASLLRQEAEVMLCDIEMPMEGSFKKWSGTSYERFIDWNILADRQTVMADEPEEGGLNDGQWHTYAFEWRTDAANGDRGVIWYRDGEKMGEAREFVPNYKAALWV